ncbi:MAG: FtsX-like permease family protein [Acidimicrobiia bacterium]
MQAVWFRFRAELRTRWRSLLAIALLAGTAGGIALAAITGARRTDTAYSRLAEATKEYHVLVNPDLGALSQLRPSDIRHLPEVTQAGHVDGVLVATTRLRSLRDFALLETTVALVPHRGAFTSFARLKLIEGRLPDPRDATEIVIDQTVARQQHLEVGAEVRGLSFSSAELAPFFIRDPAAIVAAARRKEVGTRQVFRVVGIGVQPDQIVVDQGFAQGVVLLTPAFQARYDVGRSFFGVVVRLRGGAEAIPAFRRRVERLVPNEAIAFQTAPVNASKFDRATRPEVGALTVFAVVIALTGVFLVGQAVARQGFVDGHDAATLHALGFGRRQLVAISMLRAGLTGVAGAVLAVVVAYGASPLTPIGPARTAEPEPGLAFNAVAFGVGAIGVLLGVLALAAAPAWRYATPRAAISRSRPLRAARLLADAGAPVTATTGVRFALESGRGHTAVPVRTTIVTLGLATMLIVGSVVIVASIDHLTSTPSLFGWNWDIELEAHKADAGADAAVHRRIDRFLTRSPDVRAWGTVVLSVIRLRTGAVPTFGIDPRPHDVGPSVADGRLPRRDHEVALGARTLHALDASIGSRVSVRANDGSTDRLLVVGRVVLPGVGTYPGSDKSALGEGAVVTEEALKELGPDFKRRDYVVDLAGPAASRRRVVERTEAIMGELTYFDGFEVFSLLRPSDITSYERVRTTPIALAAVLGLLAIGSVVHALVTTVRRRRHDLALLRTLGFTRRQVGAAVVWQATTVACVALLFGLPLGIALGRAGWAALADDLGTVAEPIVPVWVVVAIALGAVIVTSLAAFVPGRMAARTRPAVVLRGE